MSNLTARREEADKMVQEFKQSFYKKYGILPRVIYNIDSMSGLIPSMQNIERATNAVLEIYYPKEFPEGIKQKTNRPELSMFKQLYYFIGIDEGWHQKELARHIDQTSHTSAFHGQRKIEALLEDRDMQTLIYHSDIITKLKEYKQAETVETQ